MKPLSTKRFQLKRAGLFAFGMLIANGNFIPVHAAVKVRFPDLEINKAVTNTLTERHKAIENVLAYNSNRSKFQAVNADINVKGKVTDSKGQTLPGVNIVIKDSQKGTATDADGKFSDYGRFIGGCTCFFFHRLQNTAGYSRWKNFLRCNDAGR